MTEGMALPGLDSHHFTHILAHFWHSASSTKVLEVLIISLPTEEILRDAAHLKIYWNIYRWKTLWSEVTWLLDQTLAKAHTPQRHKMQKMQNVQKDSAGLKMKEAKHPEGHNLEQSEIYASGKIQTITMLLYLEQQGWTGRSYNQVTFASKRATWRHRIGSVAFA